MGQDNIKSICLLLKRDNTWLVCRGRTEWATGYKDDVTRCNRNLLGSFFERMPSPYDNMVNGRCCDSCSGQKAEG